MMRHRIVFATKNKGKMREVRMILGDLPCDILSMEEAGADPVIVEDGQSFAENSEKKARAVWNETKDIVLADDSGLVVDALGGEPGIYSARYLGEDVPYDVKMADILARLENVEGPERSARFVCNIAAVLPDGRVLHTEGTMEGEIAAEPAGTNGFGYDPILWLPGIGKTSAQLQPDEKNAISHRGKALRAMRECLEQVLKEEDSD